MRKLLISLLLISAIGLPGKSQQPYVIYPVPQSQQLLPGEAVITEEVNIVPAPGIDDITRARAAQILNNHGIITTESESPVAGKTNLLLGVNGTGDAADAEASRRQLDRKVFSEPKFDRHIVSLTSGDNGEAQLLVVGENTDAVFNGLATIEQILENDNSNLPCVVIYDYADQRSRGVIEGYYGVPYNAEVTKDLFKFMAKNKMNTYMYGAKSDPYHTRYWGEPYPEEITPEQQRIGYLNQEMLRDIVQTAHDSKVNFIWAIHPGNAFIDANNEGVIDSIMNKFQSMYDLGVRQFGVFVDDVGVPYDKETQMLGAERLTKLQESIDKRWNSNPKASPADTVKPLQYVPQLYAYSWTTPDKAQGFFESLSGTPDKIDIYITGKNIWSVPNSEDLEHVTEWLGRDLAWWWNYPCNDNDMTKIFPMDTYTNFRDEKHIYNQATLEPALKGTNTLIANPMQQGEASKIALFSVGDYAWNNAAFDNQKSWEAALNAIVGPERASDFKRVLPYLRYYDEDALSTLVDNYKQSVAAVTPNPQPLINELSEVLAACAAVGQLPNSHNESDVLLYEDIRPWLTRLQMMLMMTIDLLQGNDVTAYPDIDTDPAFQFDVLNGMGEDISLSVLTAEPSSVVLRPFITWLQEQ